MNVRKLIGSSLMGLGLLLMFVGTVSVPSTSSAAPSPLPALCNAACNGCGTPQRQDNGTYECLKQVGGVTVNGTCTNSENSVTCNGCTGGCSEKKYDGEYSCVCDI